jgi:predicted small metal-binding protein
MYTLKCGDIVEGCDAKIESDSLDDLMRQAVQHASDAHGLTDLDDATVEKVKEAITTS